jgi:hypothetical protein
MPDFEPPLIDERGRLSDFEPRTGDESYARMVGIKDGRRRRWGNRCLLAVEPNQNPYLGGLVARPSVTLIDTGDLGQSYPINIQVRFALVDPSNGQAVMPIADINPSIGDVLADPVSLVFTIRRGVDPLAPVTQDIYNMPDLAARFDCAPFDTIVTRTLGLDVAIVQPGATATQRRKSNLWIEAVASINDQVGIRDTVPGFTAVSNLFRHASKISILLLPERFARCQFIICNTSKNADLYVLFGNAAASTTNATFVLRAGNGNVYESPVGAYVGNIQGIWDGAPLDGGALVTTGSFKSAIHP